MAEKLAPVYEMSWLTLTGDDSPLIQCYTSPTWNAFETSAQRMNDCIKTMLRLEVFKGSTFARFATSKVSEIQRQLYFRVVPASVLNSLWCIRPRAGHIKTECIKYFTCTDTSQESHWVTGKTFLSTCGSHHDVPVCVKCKKVDFYIWYLIGVSIFAVVYHGWMQAHRHNTLFWRGSFLLRGAQILQIFQLQRHSTVLWVLLLGKSTDGGICSVLLRLLLAVRLKEHFCAACFGHERLH